MGILGRYWDTFLSTWNVLLHGNPANRLYGGIKIAACGELGVGVGEEERGSGEREVLEGLTGRIDGLVDVIVSKFGDADQDDEKERGKKISNPCKPTSPWLGSGDEPAAEDGAIFLGTGALSRKSLRDVSHWVEDLYRWGPHAYGVIDNPSSNRCTKKSRMTPQTKKELSIDPKQISGETTGLSIRDKAWRRSSLKTVPPKPIDDELDDQNKIKFKDPRPAMKRALSSKSFTSTDDDSKMNKFASYLKLGYGTHWSLGGSSTKSEIDSRNAETSQIPTTQPPRKDLNSFPSRASTDPPEISGGHFLIGLMGNIEKEEDEDALNEGNTADLVQHSTNANGYNARLVLRTLTLELEREEDARAEGEISIDLGVNGGESYVSSKHTGSERTGTSNASFESQDRNKTKKLRVVVYVNKPFMFIFLFELRTDALALTSLYRSLHYQIGPLQKPLLASTSYRASKPEIGTAGLDDARTPIYDLVYDPKLLTVNSTIPNIPDPFQRKSIESQNWSRIEALNAHMQVVQTYIATTTDRSELERTCKTSRGWWVVWTRVPDPDQPIGQSASNDEIPAPIEEDGRISMPSTGLLPGRFSGLTPHGTSTVGASMNSGPAHPFLETPSTTNIYPSKDKEIFLIRRASDYVPAKSSGRLISGSSTGSDASWAAGPGKLAQGIGVDTKRYIEGLLNLNR